MPRLIAEGLTEVEFHSMRSTRHSPDPESTLKEEPKGLDKAGFLSKLLWLWIDDLVNVANTMPLTEAHLGNLPAECKCEPLLLRFDEAWEKEKRDAAREVARRFSVVQAGGKEVQGKAPKPSIVRAFFSTFSRVVLCTGVVDLLSKCGQLAVPLVVQQLLRWYASGDGTLVEGVVYALVLFGLAVFFQAILQTHNFMVLYKTGMDLRTILCARIFEKSLTVSSRDRAALTTGEIVNLMSADAEKMVTTCLLVHGLWTTPLFLVASIWLLVNLVGVAIVPGIAMLLLCTPVQGMVIGLQHKLQKQVMEKSDARVKLVNEVLQGVRVVKYYNWEASFESRLSQARAEEVALIKRLATLNALNSALMTTVPMLMLIAMLVTYSLTGGDMAPETVFVAVSLLILIRFPLIMLPMTIGAVVMGLISVHRIERFLLMEDMPRFNLNANLNLNLKKKKALFPAAAAAAGGILVSSGRFQWATPAPTAAATESSPAPLAIESESDGGAGGTSSPSPASPPLPLPQTSSSSPSSPWCLELAGFEVKPGTLLAVTGRVGSGKTSLLAALLNEMDPTPTPTSTSEPVTGGPEVPVGAAAASSCAEAPMPPVVCGAVGYAAQQPWIMNATLRENVVFGKAFNEGKYREVIECCCLGPDLETLPAGDSTEIGEKGINLSGGQKARVGLARSVYADPDVLLLDDVLAAVDAHVGKKLFEACILQRLRGLGKTVVLVTNQLGLLSKCDDVIVLRDGKMVEHGACDELRRSKGAFSELMDEFVPEEDEQDEQQMGLDLDGEDGGDGLSQVELQSSQTKDAKKAKETGGGKATSLTAASTSNESNGNKNNGELIAEESKSTGTVGLKVYLLYFVTAVGGGYASVSSLFGLSVVTQVSTLVFEWWLSKWSDDWAKANSKANRDSNSKANSNSNNGLSQQEQNAYLGVYVGLGVVSMVLGLLRYLNHARHSALACHGIFQKLLSGVLNTTVEFFDTTPLGRILNRFSKDTDNIDTLLPTNLMNLDLCLMSVLGVLVMSGVLLPPFILVLLPVLVVYFRTLFRYVPVSRDLQRLESMSRSPIFSQFSETLTGTATVRAFGRTQDFVLENRGRLDQANRAFFYLHNANRWLQLRLECLGAVVITSVALIVVWSRAEEEGAVAYNSQGSEGGGASVMGGAVTVGVAGLVLTYTQQITGLMNWAVRMACEVESRMTCVERNGEYADLPPEEPPQGSQGQQQGSQQGQGKQLALVSHGKGPGLVLPPNWPEQGRVQFENVCLRYRAGLPLVLQDLTLNLKGGTKVGVCGRSGSGKSSLLVALFRMTPLAGGRILLDGVDVASLPLKTLRRTLGIIPQDPVLFVGNLRDNLDAFGEFTDAQIFDAMRCAALLKDDDVNGVNGSGGGGEEGEGATGHKARRGVSIDVDDGAEKKEDDLNKGVGSSSGGGGGMAEQHPGGLGAVVDEGGSNWSTGQRQLICLARAVLRNPKVLAIDEATANIDLETDAIVQRSIRERFKDSTTITIAHRLVTILDSDLIVTMDGGKLAECAPPAELLADQNSLFHGLCRNDASAASAAGISSSSQDLTKVC